MKMKVLLVEPDYRKTIPNNYENRADETLWYPPIGLLKLARFHKDRGDEVKFVSGFEKELFQVEDLFLEGIYWDRIYITTLFTYHFDRIVRTINKYKEAVAGTIGNIFVGGIMASLMPDEIFEDTAIYPITGVINSPEKLRLSDEKYTQGDTNIDLLAPDYSVLDEYPYYAIHETFYAYTSRGCINRCGWCGVSKIEPEYIPYIDIRPVIKKLRQERGDLPILKLMDNNVLPSTRLENIVDNLLELGYGKGEKTKENRQRVVDFNQGLDATHLTEDKMTLLAKLNIKPMRIAFDLASERREYLRAVKLAAQYGVHNISNYMLYNWIDTPRDLYERLNLNISLNDQWRKEGLQAKIYSYPMRFAPIKGLNGEDIHKSRDYVKPLPDGKYDLLNDAVWTRRFIRNIEVMKGAANGAISTTSTLAMRTVGKNYEEFMANLHMPEILLRNRNTYEKKIYPYEPNREPGNGKVEEFREFIMAFLKNPTDEFLTFFNTITKNSVEVIREYEKQCTNEVFRKWLNWYKKK